MTNHLGQSGGSENFPRPGVGLSESAGEDARVSPPPFNSDDSKGAGRLGQFETSDGLAITDAFIILGSKPIRCVSSPSSLTHSHIYGMGDYVPRWARRPRLRRLRPMIRRAEAARAVWRWSKGKPGAECALLYSYPSDLMSRGQSET